VTFPLGAAVTIAELTADPHPALRRLRAAEPVSWLPALGGWLVTRRDLAEQVLRDARGFTVDDPRFTTARVVGPSMLSLDGGEHRRHRDPFARALRRGDVSAGLAAFCAEEASRLVAALAAGSGGSGAGASGAGASGAGASGAGASRAGASGAELRRGLAGPLAVAVMAEVLGLRDVDPATLLSWYDAIVSGVSDLTRAGPAAPVPAAAAAAVRALGESMAPVIRAPGGTSLLAAAAAAGGLSIAEVTSNAAVMLFGGIETTEGMIVNALLHLLGDPAAVAAVTADRSLAGGVIDESLRLEPAAAVVDRYATAEVRLGGAAVGAGDLVVVSLAGANRDPAFFPEPDRFDPRRSNARQNLAFALGPHFCVGAQLAQLETEAAVTAVLDGLPGLRLDPARPAAPRGLVFRKPPALHVRWDAGA